MRLALLIVVLVLPLIAALAIDRSESRAGLTANYISIETLDPQMMRAAFDVRLAYAMFEGLATYDPYEFTIEPGVAERWSISDDGLTYTFHLRPDAKWSDGKPVTSRDFIVAWRQGMMPDVAPPYVDFLLVIKGARAYQKWCLDSLAALEKITDDQARAEAARGRWQKAQVKFTELVGVRAPDDATLVVTLERPTAYFLDLCGSWPTFPLPAHVVEQYWALDQATGMMGRDPRWTKPGNLVSNGPYMLKHWQFKGQLVMEANPHYHAADTVIEDTVRFIHFNDELSAFYAYRSGSLDVQFGATPLPFTADLIEQQRQGRRRNVNELGAFGTYYYAFNCRPKLADGSPNPFADARVRRAFAMTIDKQALVRDVTRVLQPVSDVFIPRGSIAGYPSPTGLPCVADAADESQRNATIQQARQLLTAAGYPGGAGLPVIDFAYNTGGGHEAVGQAVAAMWQEHLGVKVKLTGQEWKVFLRRRNTGEFMIARYGWFGDYGDPTTFLDLFKTGNGNNDTGFSDPKFDALLDQAAAELDPAARMKLLSEAERYLMADQLPMVPLYQYKLVHLFDPDRVSGVSLHPRNLQMYHRIEVKDD